MCSRRKFASRPDIPLKRCKLAVAEVSRQDMRFEFVRIVHLDLACENRGESRGSHGDQVLEAMVHVPLDHSMISRLSSVNIRVN